jgi:small subunit ribosomal protein S6
VRVYETMIIFDPDIEEQEVRDITSRASDVLTAGGGAVRNVDFWGKRPFAYEIKHKKEGWYTVLTADAGPSAIDEMSRVLSLTDAVFRHKTMRLPDDVAGAAGGS